MRPRSIFRKCREMQRNAAKCRPNWNLSRGHDWSSKSTATAVEHQSCGCTLSRETAREREGEQRSWLELELERFLISQLKVFPCTAKAFQVRDHCRRRKATLLASRLQRALGVLSKILRILTIGRLLYVNIVRMPENGEGAPQDVPNNCPTRCDEFLDVAEPIRQSSRDQRKLEGSSGLNR
jgi:hypothetical protein